MKAVRIIVIGIVQGVGFRPFIHRLAVKYGLKGYVRNVGGSEVEIHLEGSSDDIEKFINDLSKEKPPPAVIEEIIVKDVEPRNYKEFMIAPSAVGSIKRSMIPPDIGVCDYCLREVLDPNDRRYRYAFNSCAWCGPRFSMMYKVPYDRENTSMRKYKLCNECLKEYTDINNVRRYHAQGISCPKDGPKLRLLSIDGEVIECKDPIIEASKLIDEGFIVAIKGLGGYHIAALASDDNVVTKLRERKRRPRKPFAVMALNLSIIRKLVVTNEVSEEVLTSPQKPILLLPKREDSPVSPLVSPGMKVEGVFLPYTPLHYLLLMETKDKFLIMTSANIHGKPMCTDLDCIMSRLRNVVDYVLDHDREIVNRVDDSVLRFTDNELVMLRRGRGYAPAWIRLGIKLPYDVIALGAELQTAGAVAFEDKVVLTQYIGDLDDVDTLNELDKYVTYFIRNYNIDLSKAVLVIDKHPQYSSRELARKYVSNYGCKLIEVQHHYAHILSVLADRSLLPLNGKILGIAIDGVGYGDDGNIWGGEVMLINEDLSYLRVAHLEYQPLIGDIATKYPLVMAASILTKFLSEDEIIKLLGNDLRIKTALKAVKLRRYVLTSSTGRVLDAVAALLRICRFRSYEGEPAIMIEEVARDAVKVIDDIEAPIKARDSVIEVSTTKLMESVINALNNYDIKDIALSVQLALGNALGNAVIHALRGRRNVLNKVVVSGGAAVNDFIIRSIKTTLKSEGLEVLLPKRVPANDGGIALGQVVAVSRYVYS